MCNTVKFSRVAIMMVRYTISFKTPTNITQPHAHIKYTIQKCYTKPKTTWNQWKLILNYLDFSWGQGSYLGGTLFTIGSRTIIFANTQQTVPQYNWLWSSIPITDFAWMSPLTMPSYPCGRSKTMPLWRTHLAWPLEMNWSIMHWALFAKSPNCASQITRALGLVME